MPAQSINIASEAEMLQLGAAWGEHLRAGTVVFLRGELGAGKTTLARGLLAGMGVTEPVTSPTYTLMDHYPTAHGTVYHLDLYRINAAEELEMLGLRDAIDDARAVVVEWPERGGGHMPEPNLEVDIGYITRHTSQVTDANSPATTARRVRVHANNVALPLPE